MYKQEMKNDLFRNDAGTYEFSFMDLSTYILHNIAL